VRLVESIAEGGSPLIRYAKKFEKEKKLLSVETVSGLNQRWRCGDVEMWRCGDVEMMERMEIGMNMIFAWESQQDEAVYKMASVRARGITVTGNFRRFKCTTPLEYLSWCFMLRTDSSTVSSGDEKLLNVHASML